jgi:hypothetical protein
MATVAELERLQALVSRLTAVGSKQRGELIEAADWNGVVGAVIEVARAVLGDDRGDVVPDHTHTDQVTTGWLDTRLRTLVLGGPLADPAAESRLAALDRRVVRIAERIDELGAAIGRVRTDVGEVSTRDLSREADLTRFGRRLDGLGDARLDVADLRGTLRALEVEVSRAVEVGRQLEVDGQPLDVSQLVARVSAVEELRTRLTRADGSLLDAAAVDRQLSELQTTLVTEAELDEALSTVRGGISEEDRAALLETARAAAVEVATDAAQTVADALRAEIPQRLAAVDEKVAAAVSAASEALSQDLLEQTRAEITAAVTAADQAVREELGASFQGGLTQIRNELEERLTSLSDQMSFLVSSTVAEQLPPALAPIQTRVGEVAERADAALATAATADARSVATATRVEEVRREAAAERAQLAATQGKRIDDLEASLDGRIGVAVEGMRASLAADLRTDFDTARRDLEVSLTETVQKAASAEVQLLANQLRGEVRQVVTDELAAARTSLNQAIDERFSLNENRIAGLVADEVRRATGDLPQLVRHEIEAFRPELMKEVDARIDQRVSEFENRPDSQNEVNRPPTDPTTFRPTPDQPTTDRPTTFRPIDQPVTDQPPTSQPGTTRPGGQPAVQPERRGRLEDESGEAPTAEGPAGQPAPPPAKRARPAKRAAKGRRPPSSEPPEPGTT